MWEASNTCSWLVEKSLEKRPLGRPRKRSAVNITMGLPGRDCDISRWIQMAKLMPDCGMRHYKCKTFELYHQKDSFVK
jgi:hypothetical protein